MTVPLKVHENFPADGKIREIHLRFRDEHGLCRQRLITFRGRVGAPTEETQENELSQLALKLHNVLRLGAFDDCLAAARKCNCKYEATLAFLQARQ